jgi:hypothetical protein
MICSYSARSWAVHEGVAMMIGVLLLLDGIMPCTRTFSGAGGVASASLVLMSLTVSPGLMLSKEIGGSAVMTSLLG